MSRLLLRIITGLLTFILGLLSSAVSLGWGTSPAANVRSNQVVQEEPYRSEAPPARRDGGCSMRHR